MQFVSLEVNLKVSNTIFVFMFFKGFMKTITKRCGNVDKRKKYFAKLKTMVVPFGEKFE